MCWAKPDDLSGEAEDCCLRECEPSTCPGHGTTTVDVAGGQSFTLVDGDQNFIVAGPTIAAPTIAAAGATVDLAPDDDDETEAAVSIEITAAGDVGSVTEEDKAAVAAAVAAKAGLDPADIVVTVEGASIKYKITMVGAKAYDAVVAMKDDIFSKEGVKRLFGFEAVDVPKLASRRVKKKKLAAALQNPTAGSRGNFPGAMPVSGVEGMISVPDTVATIEMPVLGPPTFVLPASAGTSAVYCPPNYCDEQGLTKDLCWDGKPRRQVGDKCCECPELPIADGTPRPPEPVVPVTGATITAPVVMDGVDMPNPPIADGLVICPPGTTLKNNGCVGTGTAVVACPPGMAINTELNKCEPMIMDGLPPNGGNPAPGEVLLPGEPVVLDGMGGGNPFAVGGNPSVNPMTGQPCVGGQVYNSCGSPCTKTCDSPDPMCVKSCAMKCECPPTKPLWHNGSCVAQKECPVIADGLPYQPPETKPAEIQLRPMLVEG